MTLGIDNTAVLNKRTTAALQVPAEDRPRRRQNISLLVRCVISLVLIVVIVLRTNLSDIWETIQSANALLLSCSFVLLFVGYLISILRWRTFLQAFDINIPLLRLLMSYAVGIFFSIFLPSTVGGDAVRAYDSSRYSGQKAGPVAVVLVDRFMGAVVLAIFAAVVLLTSDNVVGRLPSLRGAIYVGVVLMLGVVAFIFIGRSHSLQSKGRPGHTGGGLVGRLLRKLIGAFRQFRGKNGVLAKGMGYSVLLQTNVIIHFYLIARSVGITVGLGNYFLIVPLAMLVTMLPITIYGIGVRENAFVFFLGMFGVAAPTAVAFTWIGFGMILIYGAMGGVVYAVRR